MNEVKQIVVKVIVGRKGRVKRSPATETILHRRAKGYVNGMTIGVMVNSAINHCLQTHILEQMQIHISFLPEDTP